MSAPMRAKSDKKGRQPFLLGSHLHETEEAAVALFGEGSPWGDAWVRFFKLDGPQRVLFLTSLRVAALAHDIGKANADFQKAVTAPGKERQAIRHEHLSALVLVLPEVERWLSASTLIDYDVVCAAVLSHHAKAAEDHDEYGWGTPHGRGWTDLHLDDPSVSEAMNCIGALAGVGDLPATLPSGHFRIEAWESTLASGKRRARELRRELSKKDEASVPSDASGSSRPRRELCAKALHRRHLLLAVKAGLMVSDAAASGLVREGHDLNQWIAAIVARPQITADEIQTKIICPRIDEIANKKPFMWAEFQKKAAKAKSRALLIAGCGSGKTLAAWAWAREQAKSHKAGRVVFLYPTRGTATEGFKDYVSFAPEADAALVSGTARFELDEMRSNPDDVRQYGREYRTQSEERLFALQHWSRRFYSATVDQFLSFMENNFGSMCLLPVLADAIVIIDEVHSFDKRMFDDLIAFLREFDVPVLCMTATLPKDRIEDLVNADLEHVSAETLQVEIPSEQHPRYRIERPTAKEPLDLVLEAYQNGLRVLWVLNTVARCQRAAELLCKQLSAEEVLVYHSRFTLRDRQKAHKTTIQAFTAPDPKQGPPKRAIAVTTQVCEMSLDLDADVLVTEISPCEALVQRFGRCNRHLTRGEVYRGRVIVVEPDSELPYEAKDLDAARVFLDSLPGEDLNQVTLAETLAELAPSSPRPMDDAAFLEGGFYAMQRPFRDSDDRSVSAVLDRDVPAVVAAWDAKQPIDGWVVPAPYWSTTDPTAGLPKWLRVADGTRYNAHLGLLVGGNRG